MTIRKGDRFLSEAFPHGVGKIAVPVPCCLKLSTRRPTTVLVGRKDMKEGGVRKRCPQCDREYLIEPTSNFGKALSLEVRVTA